MIQTDSQLSTFLDSIKDENELAIDTEFKRVNTYSPLLCLLQIATNTSAVCIDMLSISNLSPLFEKLYRENTIWIVHSARQDIEALYCVSNQIPKQLFDTQVAASFLNYPLQISYQALTEALQDVYLEKAYTRMDWTTRPLPEKAVDYALDDVRYLLKNYFHLYSTLTNENKLKWTIEESEKLLDNSLYQMSTGESWKKVKGFARLPKKVQLQAAKLASFRENQAQLQNKPRKWVMSDEKLIKFALGKEVMSTSTDKKFNNFLNKNPEIENIALSTKYHAQPTNNEKKQKEQLQKLIAIKATQYNLQPELIANTKAILNYIRGDNSVCLCKGWRYEILKEELTC